METLIDYQADRVRVLARALAETRDALVLVTNRLAELGTNAETVAASRRVLARYGVDDE